MTNLFEELACLGVFSVFVNQFERFRWFSRWYYFFFEDFVYGLLPCETREVTFRFNKILFILSQHNNFTSNFHHMKLFTSVILLFLLLTTTNTQDLFDYERFLTVFNIKFDY